MRKKIAVKFILLIMIMFGCWGCGKAAAEIALTEDKDSAAEENATKAESTPAETPVIEVICNCQCGKGSTADAPAQNVEQPPVSAEVPAEGSEQPPASGTEVPAEGVSQQPVDDGKVNINTADAAGLQTLNGIGETRAQAIISYRENYGLFQSIEEIKNVDGIKAGVYTKRKDEISVGR